MLIARILGVIPQTRLMMNICANWDSLINSECRNHTQIFKGAIGVL